MPAVPASPDASCQVAGGLQQAVVPGEVEPEQRRREPLDSGHGREQVVELRHPERALGGRKGAGVDVRPGLGAAHAATVNPYLGTECKGYSPQPIGNTSNGAA